MRYFLISMFLLAACDQSQVDVQVKAATEMPEPAVKSDTLVITTKAAVTYAPDSLQIAKRMKEIGEDTFRIGMDDYLFGLYQANEYLESQKLPVIVTKDEHYLKFVQTNGEVTIIKTDSLEELWGMYFFDPTRKPKLIDLTAIEMEYADFFKK